ncbi:MAG: ATP-binding protein [Nanoarchaeota archaeon]
MTETKKEEYNAESIKVLEGLEGVRRRPAMYIGSTSKEGLHHLVYEVVDNSVDECLAGACNTIKVTINKEGSVTVEDNGRGMPVDTHPVYKKPAMEIIVTKLHAGGKFDKKSYAVSGGLHGVGISVVAALSKKMTVEVSRDGKIYTQSYKIGKPLGDVKVCGKCEPGVTGTTVTFIPDDGIFSTLKFDFNTLATRFREICFLNAGLKILFKDEVNNKKEEFHNPGGLVEFVKWLNKTREGLHKPIYFKKQQGDVVAEIGIQYTGSYNENIHGFVNTINTIEGGTHVSGFKTALTRVINDYSQKKNIIKNGKLEGDDVREGLTAVISLRLKEPQFEGQTKTKLGNSEVKGIVDSMVTTALGEFFLENPAIANKIAQKASSALKAREAAAKAKDLVRRKNALGGSGLPGKLADCSSRKKDETELYVVEGESAGGSSKLARDKETQAILPLRGKILNVEKSNPARSLASEQISNLLTAMGTGVGDSFNIEKLRYGKIIIMSVDGEEATFIQNPLGQIHFVKIGDFIDNLLKEKENPSKYKVLCFSLKSRKTQFMNIKAVIKHSLNEKLYEIKTSYGRNVKITSSHSIFTFENNNIVLKKGNEVKLGDKIVAPMNLPIHNYSHPKKIDVLALLIKNKERIKENLYVRGDSVQELIKARVRKFHENDAKMVDSRVIIPEALAEKIIQTRQTMHLSQQFLCKQLDVKQPCVYYDWEKRKSKPAIKKFEKYLDIIGINKDEAMKEVQVEKSLLEQSWDKYYKGSGRNKLKDYIRLSDLLEDDLKYLDEKIVICPAHYGDKGIKRFVDVDEHLFRLIGFWIAEGSCSGRSGIRLSMGLNDSPMISELNESFRHIFGFEGKVFRYASRPNYFELKIVNRAAALFWSILLDFFKCSSTTKKMPNLVFNVSKELQLELLRAYFLGDGTISKQGISFTTVSKDLANQLMYLLLSHGVMSSLSQREPSSNLKIISKNRVYTVSITSKNSLVCLKKVWSSHRNAFYLDKKLNSSFPSINQKFCQVSDDLVALDVSGVREVAPSNGCVYDFSVDEDENFVAGMGGLCCHNSDADVDGQHIKTLLLTLFYRYTPQLIEAGNIFVAVPPLFKIRKGQTDYYVYSDEELKKMIDKIGGKTDVQRFKGLGEMNGDQLWDTTMNPKTRILKQVSIEDAVEADETFSILMGDAVEPRRKFIEENAKYAELDL